MVDAGAGEIFDGSMGGYDLAFVRAVSSAVKVPVVACGGPGKVADFVDAAKAGASAVSAGSMFVFVGKRRAILINHPKQEELQPLFEAA